jgi:hypothetical protein
VRGSLGPGSFIQVITGRPTLLRRGILVDRQFTMTDLDQLRLTDVTEHSTKEGQLYCVGVVDAAALLLSRRPLTLAFGIIRGRKSSGSQRWKLDPEGHGWRRWPFLTGSAGFEVLSAQACPGRRCRRSPRCMPLRRSRLHGPASGSSHILEVVTGLSASASERGGARAGIRPVAAHADRGEAAKFAELAASGEAISMRTPRRMRLNYEPPGLWGRSITAMPVPPRHSAAWTSESSRRSQKRCASRRILPRRPGSGPGDWRKEILSGRHPAQEVPVPSLATVYRVIRSLNGARHTLGSAARWRSNATSRPRRLPSPARRGPGTSCRST